MISVTVPELGDASDVEVIELCVKPGDRVAVDDPLIVIESDKASLEIPAPQAGIVRALTVAIGDRCQEGDVIAELETEDAAVDKEPAAAVDKAPAAAVEEAPAAAVDKAPAAAVEEAPAAPASTTVLEVTVPELGDAAEVVVVDLMVAVGDTVELDQGLVALESDKATMEVPAPQAGRVLELCLAVGEAVTDGALVARLEVVGTGSPAPGAPEAPAAAEVPAAPADAPAPVAAAPVSAAAAPSSEALAGSGDDGGAVYAGPAVRRLARELGVTLAGVTGSGSRGRITKEDLKAHVKAQMTAPASPATGGGAIPPIPPVDFERFGPIRLEPISRMMRAGAANLHRSWLNIPHVTQHDEADITALEAFRKSLKDDPAAGGAKVTPLAFILKAVAGALKAYPRVGGSFHADGEHYVLKDFIHIGIAVDTPEGLIVPVLRDVDQKGVLALSEEIVSLSERARARNLKPDELRGGCFSVSSLGAIGGTGFTPIINPPEVAILGVAKLRKAPLWTGEGFEPRDVLPLSLSYDHRAINGAEAGRFMTHLCHLLADVRRLML
ncbi:MAG: dihydrolipoyllysine-residue acetyltransferase [Pseudomonadales bacterium]|jgi:pyruvate dehydrogenase E2 component (dihydrolipoamide acetyltransferase)